MNNLNINMTKLFLEQNNSRYRFALDDEDLSTFKIIVDKILSVEPVKFCGFICYDELLMDFNNQEFLYSDSLIIATKLTINEIETLFKEYGKNICPSYIEEYPINIVITKEWEDVKKYIYQEDIQLNIQNLKILYWN